MYRYSAQLAPGQRKSCGVLTVVCFVAPFASARPTSLVWWLTSLIFCVLCGFFLIAAVTNRYPWQLLRSRAGERTRS